MQILSCLEIFIPYGADHSAQYRRSTLPRQCDRSPVLGDISGFRKSPCHKPWRHLFLICAGAITGKHNRFIAKLNPVWITRVKKAGAGKTVINWQVNGAADPAVWDFRAI